MVVRGSFILVSYGSLTGLLSTGFESSYHASPSALVRNSTRGLIALQAEAYP